MSKSDLLLSSLSKFFDVPEHREQLRDILDHRKGISLRKLEWFVTYNAPNGKIFTVHVAYKSSLDGYSKKLFDPFCRTSRIDFHGFTTTVAQLNFIRWCITNGIIDYMLIQKDSLQTHSETQEKSTHSKIRKECTLASVEMCSSC